MGFRHLLRKENHVSSCLKSNMDDDDDDDDDYDDDDVYEEIAWPISSHLTIRALSKIQQMTRKG